MPTDAVYEVPLDASRDSDVFADDAEETYVLSVIADHSQRLGIHLQLDGVTDELVYMRTAGKAYAMQRPKFQPAS